MKYRAMQISDYEPVIQLWRNREALGLRRAELRAGIEKSPAYVLQDNQAGPKYWSSRGWIERAEIAVYSFISGNNENA